MCTQSTLARALLDLNKTLEAEALLTDLLDGCVRVHGPDSKATRRAIKRYASLVCSTQLTARHVKAVRRRLRQRGCDVSELENLA